MERVEIENKSLHDEINSVRNVSKVREDQYENEVRTLKRNIDETLFEVEKLKKEGVFNLDMEKSTKANEINRLMADLEKEKKDK